MRVLRAPIILYRWLISPLLGQGKCRYYPICSAYALEALKLHGPVKGVFLAACRICACHPYSRRPFHDPVPSVIKPPHYHDAEN